MIVTMITVGYGDITPVSNLEKILCIFTMMISCGVFGYTLNFVGTIIQNLTQESKKIKQNLKIINKYMNNKRISKNLQY